MDSLEPEDIKRDFKKLRQVGQARHYVTAFRKWVSRLHNCPALMRPREYYSDQVIIDAFVDGLQHNVQVHLRLAAPKTLEAAFGQAQAIDPVTFASSRAAAQGRHPVSGAFPDRERNTGSRTPSRHGSPAPFSRATSRGGSVPPGTPVSAIQQLRSLLAALEQGESEPDEENQDPQEFNSVDTRRASTSSKGDISWAKAGVKWVEGKKWILRLDDSQRQYCRDHGICMRCRGKGCPVGDCKNPPDFTLRRANAIEDEASNDQVSERE